MKIKELLEATAEKDIELSRKYGVIAESVYNKLKEKVNNKELKIYRSDFPAAVLKKKALGDFSYEKNFTIIHKVDGKAMEFIISNKKNAVYGGRYISYVGNYHNIEINLGSVKGKTYLDKITKHKKEIISIIIHELLHHYRNSTNNNFVVRPVKAKGNREYANPVEFDAYYIETLHTIDRLVKRNHWVIEGSFDEFLKNIMNKNGSIHEFLFRGEKVDKYNKKLTKRLYVYYTKKRKDLGI